MLVDTLIEAPSSALSGVARVLVHGGKLKVQRAEELTAQARDKRVSFIAALMESGDLTPSSLAPSLSTALAVPLLDLAALDAQKLPRSILDTKLISQYKVLPLAKRGSRLFLACADPTDQEAGERIKFATQLAPEWGLVEDDKLHRRLDNQGT